MFIKGNNIKVLVIVLNNLILCNNSRC